MDEVKRVSSIWEGGATPDFRKEMLHSAHRRAASLVTDFTGDRSLLGQIGDLSPEGDRPTIRPKAESVAP